MYNTGHQPMCSPVSVWAWGEWKTMYTSILAKCINQYQVQRDATHLDIFVNHPVIPGVSPASAAAMHTLTCPHHRRFQAVLVRHLDLESVHPPFCLTVRGKKGTSTLILWLEMDVVTPQPTDHYPDRVLDFRLCCFVKIYFVNKNGDVLVEGVRY